MRLLNTTFIPAAFLFFFYLSYFKSTRTQLRPFLRFLCGKHSGEHIVIAHVKISADFFLLFVIFLTSQPGRQEVICP